MWRSRRLSLGPREQLNQASSYLDGSSVYGNTLKLQNDLRSWTGGRMKVFVTEYGKQLLPPNKDPLDGCNEESEMKKGRYCFLSGELCACKFCKIITKKGKVGNSYVVQM